MNEKYKSFISIVEACMHWVPDSIYLRIKFKRRMGYTLNLKNPRTFSEKLQWLKLNDRKPLYTTLVDKYEVKKYISSILGGEYIIPTYGVWETFDDIPFDELPNQFVLKCTHDSGGLIVCRDKNSLDIKKAKEKINKSLRTNYYWHGREWAYKNVKPRIIAEQYMEDSASPELRDYKFYCFNGRPLFLYLSEGLENHETARISYVTMEWEKAEFSRIDYKPFDVLPEKPIQFEKMKEIACILSKETKFARIDLYEINGRVYFGEFTLFPGIGMNKFNPEKWDLELGKLLKLE